MKNLLLLILIILSSCSNDSSIAEKKQSTDPLIGKWTVGKTVFVNDNLKTEIGANICDLQTNYTYNSDNTLKIISYVKSMNGCDFESETFEYLKWVNNDNDTYSFITKKPNENEEIDTQTIIFLNSNTMKWVEFRNFNNYFDSNDNNQYTSRESWFNK